jgi:hypothetical protein
VQEDRRVVGEEAVVGRLGAKAGKMAALGDEMRTPRLERAENGGAMLMPRME